MFDLAIRLILAHLIGDFVLQSDKGVIDKNKKKIASKFLYFHIGIHAILLLLFTGFDAQYYSAIAVLVLSHWLIDVAKLYLQNKQNEKWSFVIDQALHLAAIAMVVYYFYPYQLHWQQWISTSSLLLISALVCTTYVSAVWIKLLIKKFSVPNQATNNAGKYIGILERLFIFFFVYIDYWEGIGFLLAAKSIFRFGDLTQAKDIKLTEYILIGTLLSFGFAIGIAKLYTEIAKCIL